MFLVYHVEKNESWRTFSTDTTIALDVDSHDQWKFFGAKGYPNNESGKMVSITNYERVAWGKIGLFLVPDNPLGYGLIEESFGKLTKQKWPESSLRQSHSGWLDLTLGIGIPGLILVWAAMLGSFTLLGVAPDSLITPWVNACRWILLASFLIWFTTEISQRVFFDALIFWIAFSSGLVAVLLPRLAPASVSKAPPHLQQLNSGGSASEGVVR